MKRFATGLLAMALVLATALLPGTAFAASDAEMVTDLVQLENGNIKVTADLKNAKEATGYWYIGVFPAGDEDAAPVAEKEADGYNGTSFTAEFDINEIDAGNYEVFIMFEGIIDGEEDAFFDFIDLEIEDEDDGGQDNGGQDNGNNNGGTNNGGQDNGNNNGGTNNGGQDNGNNNGGTNNGGQDNGNNNGGTNNGGKDSGNNNGGDDKPSVTPKPGKAPVKVDPEQGKEMKEEVKGGKLPKTATTYPTGAAAGLALLLGGLALLKLRRTA